MRERQGGGLSRRPSILAERRWRHLLLLVALALGQAASMLVTAFATRDVFVYLRDGGEERPDLALVSIALAGVALCALRALEGRVGEQAGQSYAAAIRHNLFCHMTRMPVRDIAQRRSGALALRYVGDLAAFKGWIARGLARLVSAAITIPAALLILYLLDTALFLAAIGPILLVIAAMLLFGRPLGKAHSDLRRKRARLAASMAERLPQGVQLRRSGRLRTELRSLGTQSRAIADAGAHREWLASTVRAMPDAASGLAGALCLLACMKHDLGVPGAVAALTALSMVVWPLRHLADVTDRLYAFSVASKKLDALLNSQRLPADAKTSPKAKKLAIHIEAARMPGLAPVDLKLAAGQRRRLAGPAGCGKSALILALAGLDRAPKSRRFEVCGLTAGTSKPGHILYLGRQSPTLKGTLRREATLGIGRKPKDDEIILALGRAGLNDLVERLGGLSGTVSEGRRNLTSTEQSRILLTRGFLARPKLALVDADEIGLTGKALSSLIEHFESIGAAALIVTSDPHAAVRIGFRLELIQKQTGRKKAVATA